MKKLIMVFGIGLLAVMGLYAGSRSSVSMSDRYIDYRIRGNEYAVIYVNTDKESQRAVEKKAMQRAAEVTADNGYRYFKVESEKNVYVAQSRQPGQRYPTNLYQELIVEGDFGRDQYGQEPGYPQRSGVFPAYKIVISVYEKKPMGRSKDACNYTNCD